LTFLKIVYNIFFNLSTQFYIIINDNDISRYTITIYTHIYTYIQLSTKLFTIYPQSRFFGHTISTFSTIQDSTIPPFPPSKSENSRYNIN
jgi:hypothetical protein